MLSRVLMTTAAVVALATPALAQRGGGPHGPGGGLLNRDLEVLAERLELSDEQRAGIAKIRKGFSADIADDRRKVTSLRRELQALWTSGEVPEKDAVLKLQAEMRGYRVRIVDRAVDARIEVLRILTPEQRKKLGELRRERQRQRRERRGRGSGRGTGGDG